MRPECDVGVKLGREDVIRLAEMANTAGEALDLSGYDLSGTDLGGKEVVLANVIFGRHHGPPPAILTGTTFRCSTLDHCFFAHADLTGADFRECGINRGDFRYAIFRRTTLGDATLVLCDLYRASVEEGTVMLNTVFELVSLPGSLSGATGLRWASFAGRGPRPPLVAESEADYRDFLERTKPDRPETDPIEKALANRLDDAARTYRELCGLWTGRGQFSDAGQAYAHSRRLERQSAGPGGREFRPLLWFWLLVADGLCGFGERLGRIVPWLVAVALLPGLVYWLFGGVGGAHEIGDYLLFSASQLTASTPARLTATTQAVEWIRVLQTLTGVALLGLFGFVLGNKIRNS
jgi:Pentapeptide repeats (8 copies)